MKLIHMLRALNDSVFSALENALDKWFLGLGARLVFGSVLLMFFINSAATKVGEGFPGILIPEAGAYIQILPPIFEEAGYNVDKVAFFPWGLIVHLGTYAEFLIPLLVVIGLFTRLSSLAMLGFIGVMTFVDIHFHGVDEKTVGGFFDRIHDSVISDQRLLWVFPLVYLVIKGPGLISADQGLKGLMSRAGHH